jgi:hypothetical protein
MLLDENETNKYKNNWTKVNLLEYHRLLAGIKQSGKQPRHLPMDLQYHL